MFVYAKDGKTKGGDFMSSLTLSVPTDLKQRMESFKYINWSEVARQAIINKLHLLARMDKFLSKSSLTQEDTIRIGRTIKKRQWLKTKKLFK